MNCKLIDRLGRGNFVALTIVLISLLLEVFAFNYRFWQTLPSDESPLAFTAEEVSQAGVTLSALHIDTETESVAFSAYGADSAEIRLFDEGNELGYELPVMPVDEGRNVFSIHPYGRLLSLELVLQSSDVVDEEVRCDSLSIGATVPFDFSLLRFSFLVGIGLFFYLFRPSGSVYKMPLFEPLSRRVVACSVAVACVFAGIGMALNPFFVGVSTPFYNSNQWDPNEGFVQLSEVPYSAHWQYAELARAFAQGEVSLEEEPPEFMKEIDNPYSPLRGSVAVQQDESLRNDVAYFDGHYYVYFGVLPVLLFYLPFYLATGSDLPSAIPAFLSLCLFVAGVAFLIWSIAQRWFKATNLGIFLLVFAGSLLACQVVFAISMPTFYFIPILLGLACAVFGVGLYVRASVDEGGVCGKICMGSFLLACTLACRPQLILAALFALPFGIVACARSRNKWAVLACGLLPFVVVFCAVGWYNWIRFGSPIEFGANFNLTYNDMTKREPDLGLLAPGLFFYLIQPPQISATFPFLHSSDTATGFMGVSITQSMFGGLLCIAPFVWGGLATAFLPSDGKLRFVKLFAMGGIASCVLLFAFDTVGAGILTRYFLDAAPFMALVSVPFWLYCGEKVFAEESEGDSSASIHKNPLTKGYVVILAFMVFVSFIHSSLVMLVGSEGDFTLLGLEGLRSVLQFWM